MPSIHLLSLGVAVLLASILTVVAQETTTVRLVGAFSKVNVSDELVRKAAEFAIEAIKKDNHPDHEIVLVRRLCEVLFFS